jgi:hypothetical protein
LFTSTSGSKLREKPARTTDAGAGERRRMSLVGIANLEFPTVTSAAKEAVLF